VSKRIKFLTVALVLVVLLAAFAGAACTGNVASADDEVTQVRYGQNGVQGQNYNGNGERICDGDCDGICQGNCNGNCNGDCDGDCDGTCQGNCNGDCDGAGPGTAGGCRNNSGNGCRGACNGISD
jgi:hypothetical protein